VALLDERFLLRIKTGLWGFKQKHHGLPEGYHYGMFHAIKTNSISMSMEFIGFCS
jgi:hypothetical protein